MAPPAPRKSLLGELKRRHVFRVGATYVVVAFVVIQSADVLTNALALPPYTLTLVTVLSLLGFPIAMVLAWAYELTDHGVVKDEELSGVDRVEKPVQPLDPTGIDPHSVAVLPFANLSGGEDNEYFSDGITEDIITGLSKLRDLHVVSRTSVMRYKNSAEPLREIARTLRVATVLEGSVRRADDRVRISAQLIDALADRHLWVESYDHRLEDIFEIQADVSNRIARALAAELTPEEREGLETRPTLDVEAYDLYLKGRHLWGRRTAEGIAKSIAYYERALERDPKFALAEAGLADSYLTLGLYGVRAPAEVMPRSREAATRALSIHPQAPEAMTSLATVRALYDWDWPAAERDFRRAIAILPNYPVAHHWYASNLLTPLGRFEEAREATRRALELDPLSSAVATSHGVIGLYSGDCESAIDEFTQVLDVHDRFGMACYFKGQAHLAIGEMDEAIRALERADDLMDSGSEVVATLGHAYAVAGREDDARTQLTKLERRFADEYCSPGLLAQIHLGLGDRERALALLEDAAAARAVEIVWLGVRPIYDELRDDARFQALLERVGLAPDSS
jgi:eukaryotic-like serine/threonine-protein kinase